MLLACAKHTIMNRWCSHFLESEFDVNRWPNLIFYHLFGCAIVSFSTWCDTRWCMIVILSSMVVYFFSLLFSLLPDTVFSFFFSSFFLLTGKMHDCPFYFWLFNFSLCSFDLLFWSYSFYRSFCFSI